MSSLQGKIAVVTGASRGAGRGMAVVLGEAGATVYVTGRSATGEPTTENRPETIDETAELVTARGGIGIPVRVDHTVDADVAALFERVKAEQGRLDLLVNNAWGGYEHYDHAAFGIPFWKQPFSQRWDGMFMAGVRAHLLASYLAVPLMLQQQTGLIINTIAWDHDKYLATLFYDVAKHSIVRMTFGMARELQKHHLAVIALAPGFMRTERVLDTVKDWPESEFDLSTTESPEYTGRAVVALASDPNVMQKSGKAFRVGELSVEYEFTDIDGRHVPPFTIPE